LVWDRRGAKYFGEKGPARKRALGRKRPCVRGQPQDKSVHRKGKNLKNQKKKNVLRKKREETSSMG